MVKNNNKNAITTAVSDAYEPIHQLIESLESGPSLTDSGHVKEWVARMEPLANYYINSQFETSA